MRTTENLCVPLPLSFPRRHTEDLISLRTQKRYGYDASSYTSHPTSILDSMLTDMLSSGLPIHVLPGAEDPVGSILPQQPLPRAMLRHAAMGGGKSLSMETNPAWIELGGKSFLGVGGQTVDDVFKYLPSDDRLSMARRTLEWRHVAPTAPDTLCESFGPVVFKSCILSAFVCATGCFPFSDKDPFIIERRPDVYFIGNQPEFRTALVGGECRVGHIPCHLFHITNT